MVLWHLHYSDVLKQYIIITKAYIPMNTPELAIASDHVDKSKQFQAEVKITQN